MKFLLTETLGEYFASLSTFTGVFPVEVEGYKTKGGAYGIAAKNLRDEGFTDAKGSDYIFLEDEIEVLSEGLSIEEKYEALVYSINFILGLGLDSNNTILAIEDVMTEHKGEKL